MAKIPSSQSSAAIRKLIESILESHKITRQEHLQLTSAILSNKNLTEEDLRQINRVFDPLQMGRLEILDTLSTL